MQVFRDGTAVITGAASGIGLALAKRAAAEGMNLVLADIELEKLTQSAGTLGVDASRLVLQRVDVSRDEDIGALADAAFSRFGAVHLLCNNAGVALTRVSWECTLKDWEWVLGVNLWSVIHGIRHFVPRMLEQADESHVVNTASVAGLLSNPGIAAYNVSKHGAVTLSETLYGELQAIGAKVGVSLLCPAWVSTAIYNSERNRQDRYGPLGEAGTVSRRYEKKMEKAAGERMTAAADAVRLTADDMAAAVFSAVSENRFYVIPHRKVTNAVKLRMEDIIALRNPTPLG